MKEVRLAHCFYGNESWKQKFLSRKENTRSFWCKDLRKNDEQDEEDMLHMMTLVEETEGTESS